MASLKDIRSRMGSVKNTQQITKAMKMVSAVKLRRAQDNITHLRPYAKSLISVIADIAITHRVSHSLLSQVREPKKVLLVVINSDRGLCGGFNTNVSRFAEDYYRQHQLHLELLDIMVIGRKALDYLNRRKIKVKESILNLAKDISYSMASDIAEKLMSAFSVGQYEEIRFIYNEFKSAISQNLVSETILPVDIRQASFSKSHSFSKDLIFEPQPSQMMDSLLFKHFAVQVYRCLSESVAGEHAARMTAMDAATNNANDMIDTLTLTYNKLRQAAITTELTEISSGAEALKGS